MWFRKVKKTEKKDNIVKEYMAPAFPLKKSDNV